MKRILFANIPGHGHFNPLTGLAAHLKNQGHDVRWYAGAIHHKKIAELSIPVFPFRKARDIDPSRLDEIFPERVAITSQIKKLRFDLRNIFILRATEFYADIREIDAVFPFDLLICDISFTALPFVKERMKRPVFSVGIFPVMETSKDLPPYGLAMTPSYSPLGRLKQNLFRYLADHVFFKESNEHIRSILREHGIESNKNIFDTAHEKSTLVLQNGTPGFEYKRSDWSKNIRFMGPLFPPAKRQSHGFSLQDKREGFDKVILVTQGTVEQNVNKLIVPTLEAFRNTDHLVIATTGGSQTRELRAQFPERNIVIEDFIPFDDVMPHCDVYITNGGFGGVMYGIRHKLPLVVAGVHEGKNEINARVGYLKLGVNLGTETPKPLQIRRAVDKILRDRTYKENVTSLSREFEQFQPGPLLDQYIAEIAEHELQTVTH